MASRSQVRNNLLSQVRRKPFPTHPEPFFLTGLLRQPESVKSQQHVELKWCLRPQNKNAGQSSRMGQVVARQFLKNMSQGLFSWCGVFWDIPCNGADVYREQRNKPIENQCIIVRCAAAKCWEVTLDSLVIPYGMMGKTRNDRPLSTVLLCHFPKIQFL